MSRLSCYPVRWREERRRAAAFLAADEGNWVAHITFRWVVDNDEDGRPGDTPDEETKMVRDVALQCLAIGGTRNCLPSVIVEWDYIQAHPAPSSFPHSSHPCLIQFNPQPSPESTPERARPRLHRRIATLRVLVPT